MEGTGNEGEWLADYRNRVEDVHERAGHVEDRLRQVRGRAVSPDNAVSVELAPSGNVEELELSNGAMRLGPGRLATIIKQTIQSAHADAAKQTEEAVKGLVGESDALEFLREHIGVPEEDREPDQHDVARAPSSVRNRQHRR